MAYGRNAPDDLQTRRDLHALRARVETAVRDHPLVAVGAAAGVGALLGGLLLRNAGRFVFVAAASAVLADVWKSEGGVDIRELLDRIAGDEPRAREPKKRAGLA
jgi:hypothetical protein